MALSNKEIDNFLAEKNRISKIMSKPLIECKIAENYASAKWQFNYICEQIKDFERKLDNDHEVALLLTNFGQSIMLNVTRIGYQDPCLIYYYGTVNGKTSQLIQHISQISFLLMSVEKQIPQNPARRIGFGS